MKYVKAYLVFFFIIIPFKVISCENLSDPSWWESYPEKTEILSEIGMCSDINLPGKSEFPPLHSAIFVGNLEGAQLLIEAGADVNLLNDDGYGSYTPLHQVIISLNQVEQIELRDNFIVTLVAAGADPNITDYNNMSALDWAKLNIDKGDPFRFLNSKGLKVLENPSLVNEIFAQDENSNKSTQVCEHLCNDDAWMEEATYNNTYEFVQWALESGEDVLAQSVNEYKAYPLHYAAFYGDPRTIEFLVKNGADIYMKDAFGASPLFWALSKPDNVEILIKLGSDVNERNTDGNTPLLSLTSNWNYEETTVIKQLLLAGANVNEKTDYGSTPFGLALAFKNNKQILKILLDNGADVKLDGQGGEFVTDSNLHTAASLLWDTDILQLLIDEGLDVNILGVNGQTPLHNVINSQTAISQGFGADSYNTVKFLLEKGADTSIKDDFGLTALDWTSDEAVKEKITTEIIDLLQMSSQTKKSNWPKSELKKDFLFSGKCEGPDIGVVNLEITTDKIFATDNNNQLLYEGKIDGPVQVDIDEGWIYDEGKIIGRCKLEQKENAINVINNTNKNEVEYPLKGISWGGKVRSGPGLDYPQVGSLIEGETIKLLENTEVWMDGFVWFRILYQGSEVGYKWGGILCAFDDRLEGIYSEKSSGIKNCGLKNNDTNSTAQSTEGILGCSCGGKVRSGPGKQYSSIGSLSYGSPITLLRKKNTWYEILYEGKNIGFQWQGIICTYKDKRADGVDPCCNSAGQCE